MLPLVRRGLEAYNRVDDQPFPHTRAPQPRKESIVSQFIPRQPSELNSGYAQPEAAPAYQPAPQPAVSVQQSAAQPKNGYLQEPKTMAETGLSPSLVTELVLKVLYYQSYQTGYEMASQLRLPFYGVIEVVMQALKREELVELTGASGLGAAGYQYVMTRKGMDRAEAVLKRNSYVGPAPVPLSKYIEMVLLQAQHKPQINQAVVQNALRGMNLVGDTIDKVGAAVNAGRSLFLFGSPGNGKSMLTERIGMMMGDAVVVPYALEADGQIIQFFDLHLHHAIAFPGPNGLPPPSLSGLVDPIHAECADRRWVQVQRPLVITGGELTMTDLDLVWHGDTGFYEAPYQLKANNGVFLIDDFGRQVMSPQQLLNRWIVPLEKGTDFLTLHTGKKLQVPFELFLVFSTNLEPAELVDEAFLRRIQNKLHMPDPSLDQFRNIFMAECQRLGIPYDESAFSHLVREHYMKTNRPMRAVHPRDILRQLTSLARYQNIAPQLSPRLIDLAAATYFVPLGEKKATSGS